jgi:hypothetical protein
MNQQPWINLAAALIAGLGIGSVITALIQHSLKRREVAHQSQREALEARYKVIILLMYAAYDFESNEAPMRINRPDLKSRNDVLENLHAEWINATLFASESTLNALCHFLSDPSFKHLAECAVSMRQDLGRGSLPLKDLDVPVRLKVK